MSSTSESSAPWTVTNCAKFNPSPCNLPVRRRNVAHMQILPEREKGEWSAGRTRSERFLFFFRSKGNWNARAAEYVPPNPCASSPRGGGSYAGS